VNFQTLDQDYSERGGNLAWTWIRSTDLRFNALMKLPLNERFRVSIDRTLTAPSAGERENLRNLSSNVDGHLNVGRFVRESTAPLSSYVDNQVALILGYSFRVSSTSDRGGNRTCI